MPDLLRHLMTKEIEHYDWLDWSYERGDYQARSFSSYRDWLNSLTDDNFLYSYNSVRDAERDLD